MAEVKLSKSLDIDGKQRDKLVLNLDALTGADVLFCEREMLAANAGQPVLALVLSSEFHVQLAARACGIEAAALKKLPATDFLAVTGKVRNFLLGTD